MLLTHRYLGVQLRRTVTLILMHAGTMQHFSWSSAVLYSWNASDKWEPG